MNLDQEENYVYYHYVERRGRALRLGITRH